MPLLYKASRARSFVRSLYYLKRITTTAVPSIYYPTSTALSLSDFEMSQAMAITFIGTSSGGGPTNTRNCSCLVADLLRNGDLWMVDCAEGTVRQFQTQPNRDNNPRITKVKKLFITHMHADHVMGIIPFLRNILYPPPIGAIPHDISRNPIRVEIYGPAGIRTFVRSIMKMTFTRTSDRYVVHELLKPEDPVTPCIEDMMHVNEIVGEDIMCGDDGFWRSFTSGEGVFGEIMADAGSISHRDPCLGFVFRESVEPFRKVVILGDTFDASDIIPLCVNPSPSLLVHEATDAHISSDIDYKQKRTPETVLEKTLARGHSLPTMAGDFARKVGAQKLILNHIGGRFPALASDKDRFRRSVINEIERQASEAWGMGRARAAWDFMRVAVPAPEPPQENRSKGWEREYPNIELTGWSDPPLQRPQSNGHPRKRQRDGRR